MRALPASVFLGLPEDITVDASFVAERLGSSERELRQAIRVGRVTATMEHDVGDDDRRVRVSFRAGARAWSAVIEPDGRAYELESDLLRDRTPHRLPGPGLRPGTGGLATALTLNQIGLLVRSILLQRVGETRYIEESELQNRLAAAGPIGDPNLHRRALAFLMHEDQRAGRPFLAALVKADADERPWDGFTEAASRCAPGRESSLAGDDGGALWRAEADRARSFYKSSAGNEDAVRSKRPRHSRGRQATTLRDVSSMDCPEQPQMGSDAGVPTLVPGTRPRSAVPN